MAFLVLYVVLIAVVLVLRASAESHSCALATGEQDGAWSPEPQFAHQLDLEARVEPPLSWASIFAAFVRWCRAS